MKMSWCSVKPGKLACQEFRSVFNAKGWRITVTLRKQKVLFLINVLYITKGNYSSGFFIWHFLEHIRKCGCLQWFLTQLPRLCSLYVSNQSMMDAQEQDYQQNIHCDFPCESFKQGQNLNMAFILIHKWTNFCRCSVLWSLRLEKRERATKNKTLDSRMVLAVVEGQQIQDLQLKNSIKMSLKISGKAL